VKQLQWEKDQENKRMQKEAGRIQERAEREKHDY
jgi:hypothetical protein